MLPCDGSPRLITHTNYEPETAIFHETIRGYSTCRKVVKGLREGLIVVPRGHDNIEVVRSCKSSFGYVVFSKKLVNDVMEFLAARAPNAEVDHSPTKGSRRKLRNRLVVRQDGIC